MEPFKEKIDAGTIDAIAALVPGDWDRDGFRVAALRGLDALELKERVNQVADALYAAIPGDFPATLAQVMAGVPEPERAAGAIPESWAFWPLCSLVERHGIDHFEPSLDAMERLTEHWSCEFAIRPFFEADPERVLERLRRWAGHESAHVRRLVSEGSRPRLPWGIRLQHRIDHPEATLPMLERLRDDPDEVVRRSVANHLNDIEKDHPDLVIAVAEQWLIGADAARRKLVKHALRTRIKAGDPRAYALIGLHPFQGSVEVSAQPSRIAIGDAVQLTVTVTSTATHPQRVRLDLGVHHRLKSGALSAKVFHWTERTVQPGEALTLHKAHTVRKVTTRRLYPGEQAIDVRVNGQATDPIPFELEVP